MKESLFIRQANVEGLVLRPAAGSMFSKYSPLTNTVVLGTEESLRRGQCDVADLNLFDSSLLNGVTEVEVKVRYATPATPATIQPRSDGTLRILFHEPQRALSPGQSAVFYRDDRVLGGGIIQSLSPRHNPHRHIDSPHQPMLIVRAAFRASHEGFPLYQK